MKHVNVFMSVRFTFFPSYSVSNTIEAEISSQVYHSVRNRLFMVWSNITVVKYHIGLMRFNMASIYRAINGDKWTM